MCENESSIQDLNNSSSSFPSAEGPQFTSSENVPEILSDLLAQSIESDTPWPPEPTDPVFCDLGLNRHDDLSPRANWLIERLLAGAVDYGEEVDYLKWIADKEGIDLEAAIIELSNHNLLVSRQEGWIDLPRYILPRTE